MFLAWILKEMTHFYKWTTHPAVVRFKSVAHLQLLIPIILLKYSAENAPKNLLELSQSQEMQFQKQVSRLLVAVFA